MHHFYTTNICYVFCRSSERCWKI